MAADPSMDIRRQVDDVDALKYRIEELMRDNDDMRTELWAKDIALRIMAEKIDDMERGER